MKTKVLVAVMLTVVFGFGAVAFAGMNHIPSTYGLSARSVALGNAATSLTGDVSLPYFNQAAMAVTNETLLGISYLYAQPGFEGGLKGGDKETFDIANQVIAMGLTVAMDEFLKSARKIALGFNLALDDNGRAVNRYVDMPYAEGYYYRYGEANMVFNAGLGFEVVEWFYLGGGVLATFEQQATYYGDVNLRGKSENEAVEQKLDLFLTPTASLWARFNPISIGIAYRGKLHTDMDMVKVRVDNTIGESQLNQTNLDLLFKDGFLPATVSLGVSWTITPSVMMAFDLGWQHWGEFDDEMSTGDAAKENISMDWVDIYVPRLGVEYQVVENLFLRFGYGFEKSPVQKPGSDGFYVLDNDKHMASFGMGYDLDLGILNYPVSLDATFLHQYLVPRELEASNGTKFESEGNLNGGMATVTIRF